MKKLAGISAGLFTVTVVLLAVPYIVQAQTSLNQQIMPLECVVDQVNDGSSIVTDISPEQCQQLQPAQTFPANAAAGGLPGCGPFTFPCQVPETVAVVQQDQNLPLLDTERIPILRFAQGYVTQDYIIPIMAVGAGVAWTARRTYKKRRQGKVSSKKGKAAKTG